MDCYLHDLGDAFICTYCETPINPESNNYHKGFNGSRTLLDKILGTKFAIDFEIDFIIN